MMKFRPKAAKLNASKLLLKILYWDYIIIHLQALVDNNIFLILCLYPSKRF